MNSELKLEQSFISLKEKGGCGGYHQTKYIIHCTRISERHEAHRNRILQ